jgi:hypothetical protein
MRDMFDNKILDIHTWLPGQVIAVDPAMGTVFVQPELQRAYTDGTTVNLPIIQNVPIMMPSGMNYSIQLPVDIGDEGVILFCERSLASWKSDGGIVDPGDSRHHHLADAIFIPGLRPTSNPISEGTPLDMVFTNGEVQIFLQIDEMIKILNTVSSIEIEPTGAYTFKNEIAEVTADEEGNIESKNAIGSSTIDADGTITSKNALASSELGPDGTITIKNAVGTISISPTGTVDITGPMVNLGESPAFGVGLGNNIESRLSALESALATLTSVFGVVHTHPVISIGSPTGPPVPPATPFVAVPLPAASVTVMVAE